MSQRKGELSSLPLHRQIAQDIKRDIVQRGLGPHSRIPSEVELTQHYGVNHNTVNKAIEQLVQQGVLYRKRPQGTFVAASPEQKRSLPIMTR